MTRELTTVMLQSLKGEDGVVRMVLTSLADLEHLSNPTNRASYDGTIDLGAQNAWKPSGFVWYNVLCLLSEGIGSNHPRSGTTRIVRNVFSEKKLLRTTPSSPFKSGPQESKVD